MQHSVLSSSTVAPTPGRGRRLAALAVAAGIAALLAVVTVVAVQANFASFALPAPPVAGTADSTTQPHAGHGLGLAAGSDRPYLPTPEDGLIPEGIVVTPDDDDVPAIARLDPALLDALREAETDAAATNR